MTKRDQVKKFASLNGIVAKGYKGGLVVLFNPKNDKIFYFDNWDECYSFALKASQDYERPWA